MLKVLVFFAIACAVVGVNAQTAFSFSGLNWGDPLEKIDAHLQASGLPLTSGIEKLSCRIKNSCTLQFAGSVRGSIFLADGKLVEVWVFSEVGQNVYAERLARLRSKYGAPLESPPRAGIFELLKTKWQAPNGETLELDTNGHIRYRSAPAARGAEQDVKF